MTTWLEFRFYLGAGRNLLKDCCAAIFSTVGFHFALQNDPQIFLKTAMSESWLAAAPCQLNNETEFCCTLSHNITHVEDCPLSNVILQLAFIFFFLPSFRCNSILTWNIIWRGTSKQKNRDVRSGKKEELGWGFGERARWGVTWLPWAPLLEEGS